MQGRGERDSRERKERNSKHEHKKKMLKENVYISSTIHHLFEFINLISYTYECYESDFLQYFVSDILLHLSGDIHQSLCCKNLSHHDAVLTTSCKLRSTFQ